MDELRASRLKDRTSQTRFALFDNYLPLGTLRRKLTLWIGLPLLVFIILVLIVDKIVMPTITRHGEEFPLPDFTERPLAEAQDSLERMDLRHEVSSELFTPDKEPGIILSQYPEPGTKVKSGRSVKFVISLGEKMVPIPVLSGKSVRQAMLDLEANGLTLGDIAWAFSDTIPERVVVFSYPNAGTEVPLATPVNLMVNRGRSSNFTYVLNVVGMPLPQATRKLEEKALKAGIITYRVDDQYLPETVLEQSEPEGTELDINTEIDLVVSSTE
jgi:serine/threonine-protein kinase